MEPSATSTTVTGPVGERLQVSTGDAPVLDRPAPLRRLHDSGAKYKYPNLNLLTYYQTNSNQIWSEVSGLTFHTKFKFYASWNFAITSFTFAFGHC